MKVLREVNGYKLNQGNNMANGLFNISDENDNVSFWFDDETAQEMLNMTDEEFINDAIALINHSMEVYNEN
jgi:hypothetical protein